MELNSPVAIIFANIKGNIGDFAILHAMLVDLRRLHPERPLHVFPHSCHNIDQLKFDAFRAADVPNFTLCSPIFSRELPFPLKLLSYAGLWPLARMIFVRMLDRESSCNVERFTDYYAIFVAGGHQWSGI